MVLTGFELLLKSEPESPVLLLLLALAVCVGMVGNAVQFDAGKGECDAVANSVADAVVVAEAVVGTAVCDVVEEAGVSALVEVPVVCVTVVLESVVNVVLVVGHLPSPGWQLLAPLQTFPAFCIATTTL